MIPGKVSYVTKCPTNCEEHDYYFPHTVVGHRREFKDGETWYMETTEFIVCRNCSHWIAGTYNCRCRYQCHEEPGGTYVDKQAVGPVILEVTGQDIQKQEA